MTPAEIARLNRLAQRTRTDYYSEPDSVPHRLAEGTVKLISHADTMAKCLEIERHKVWDLTRRLAQLEERLL